MLNDLTARPTSKTYTRDNIAALNRCRKHNGGNIKHDKNHKGWLPQHPILGLKLLLSGFVWTIVTRQLVTKGGLSGRRQNADIDDTLHLRDVATATTF